MTNKMSTEDQGTDNKKDTGEHAKINSRGPFEFTRFLALFQGPLQKEPLKPAYKSSGSSFVPNSPKSNDQGKETLKLARPALKWKKEELKEDSEGRPAYEKPYMLWPQRGTWTCR